jgi:hypothetical protein
MFLTQSMINFFIHSGTAQAALTMPVMAPWETWWGVSRQTSVLAFQLCEFILPILPTSGGDHGGSGHGPHLLEHLGPMFFPLMLILVGLSVLLLLPLGAPVQLGTFLSDSNDRNGIVCYHQSLPPALIRPVEGYGDKTEMLAIEDALKALEVIEGRRTTETIPLLDSLGRITAAPVRSEWITRPSTSRPWTVTPFAGDDPDREWTVQGDPRRRRDAAKTGDPGNLQQDHDRGHAASGADTVVWSRTPRPKVIESD